MRSNIILSTYHIMSQANDIESARRAAALVMGMNPTMREAAKSMFELSTIPIVFPTTPPSSLPSSPVQPQLPNANAARNNPVPIQRAEQSPDFQQSPGGVVPSAPVIATSTVTGANVPDLPFL